jgi:very-short-patch-repair endonuclease
LLPEYKKSKCFFKELNNEWFINDGINFYFCDFKIENKIIEYDGMYWHNNFYEKDEIRNNTYKKMGFKVLILNENDFSEKNINTEAISKCLKFINDEK